MKVFECKTCGHIEFETATPKCLACHGATFAENSAAIKQPANPEALTDGDKKHIPQIVVVKECGLIPGGGCTDVHVKVGSIEHVMEEKHFIRYIDYYLNRKFIARMWLSPRACHPAAGLHLNATNGLITAIENCNVHGNWMNDASF